MNRTTYVFVVTCLLLSMHAYITRADEPDTKIVAYPKNTIGIDSIDVDVYPLEYRVGDVMYSKISIINDSEQAIDCGIRSLIFKQDIRVGSLKRDSYRGINIKPFRQLDYQKIACQLPTPHYSPKEKPILIEPNTKMVFGVDSYLCPSPEDYVDVFWGNISDEGVKIQFKLTTAYFNFGATVLQTVTIKPRPEAELKLISEWYEKVDMYENDWPKKLKAATAEEWKVFEEKLSEGTFRNFIHMTRDMVDIACIESIGKRAEKFAEMQKWIDKLHPLEAEGLTKRAIEIVERFPQKLNNEIDLEKIKLELKTPKDEPTAKSEQAKE